ncbi:MAG: bacteriohemerythrin [Gammaproteobacteria bacterium]|jgi:hemerythrin|nr:bacteriohemerythrin [Gammaproteobacteria bacterium]
MELLNWKPAYTLGIASVDHEHRELIDMINQVYAQLAADTDSDAIEACLEDIYAGIASHFALEERHMREAAYAEYEAHKNEHEELLDQILDLMDEFAADPKSGRATLQQELSDWFGKHFATFDARLHHSLGDH